MRINEPTASESLTRRHIPELDGIRGCAVVMVLIWHYVNCQGAGSVHSAAAYFTRATSLFWSGVDLFFVLSGFLIGGILLDYGQRSGFYRTFYVRRAVRILPVYCFTLSCFFVFRSVVDPQRFRWLFDDAIPDITYLTFTQNVAMGLRGTFGGHFLGITWSLAVEEQFYLGLPLMLLVVGIIRFKQAIVLLTVTAPFLRLAIPGFTSWINTPFRMDSLLIGVILAAMFRSDRVVTILKDNRRTLWALFAVLLFGMGMMTLRSVGRSFLDPTAIAVFYAVFIALALLHQGERVTAMLRSALFTRLGVYSYGLYMYHQMVAGLMHGYFLGESPQLVTTHGQIATFASLIVTLGLSIISHHTFEAYFINLGKRFRYDSHLSKR